MLRLPRARVHATNPRGRGPRRSQGIRAVYLISDYLGTSWYTPRARDTENDNKIVWLDTKSHSMITISQVGTRLSQHCYPETLTASSFPWRTPKTRTARPMTDAHTTMFLPRQIAIRRPNASLPTLKQTSKRPISQDASERPSKRPHILPHASDAASVASPQELTYASELVNAVDILLSTYSVQRVNSEWLAGRMRAVDGSHDCTQARADKEYRTLLDMDTL